MRRLKDASGAWQRLARNVDYPTLWPGDATEIAYTQHETTVIWQTFPDRDVIGRWDTGEFSTHPIAWLPDGRFLIVVGSVPGEWQYRFVLDARAR